MYTRTHAHTQNSCPKKEQNILKSGMNVQSIRKSIHPYLIYFKTNLTLLFVLLFSNQAKKNTPYLGSN